MGEVVTKLSLIKKSILITFLILCNFFVYMSLHSKKDWNRDRIKIFYDKSDTTVNFTCQFIDYEFGPLGEHAYLVWGDFSISTDGLEFTRLLRCKVKDQIKGTKSWVEFNEKLRGSKINVVGCNYPKSSLVWKDDINFHEEFSNYSNKSCFGIKWFVPLNSNIKQILFNGIWYVNGLYCNENYIDEIYKILYYMPLRNEENTGIKQHNGNMPDMLYPEKTTVKVNKVSDFAVISGVNQGEDIKIYTASGLQITTTIATGDDVRIKLPKNQIYILRIGKDFYKLAM